MTNDDAPTLASTLAWSARARAQARNLRAEAEKLALQIADTEEAIASNLARLASHHPPNECRLRAISAAAASHAAWEREQAAGSPPPGADGGCWPLA
jgi:hypothetical protein